MKKPSHGALLTLGILFLVGVASFSAWVLFSPAEAESRTFGLDSSLPNRGEGFSLALEQTVRVSMVEGNAVEPLFDGDLFPEIEKAIRSAKKSVHILIYIWREGEPGDSLLKALAERDRTVDCRVIADDQGSLGFEEKVLPRLLAAGCDAKIFNHVEPGSSRRATGRNHRKIVVVDGEVGFVGGFGFHRTWLGQGRTEENWRDTHARVEGPVVRQLQLAFSENWLETGGRMLPEHDYPELSPKGDAKAAFVPSTGSEGVSNSERMVLTMIAAAKTRLWIANSYFVPSDKILDQLIEKSIDGVDVRILVPGNIHDVPPVLSGQRGSYKRLLEAGVSIFEYQPSMMHAKSMVVDDALSVIGSTNMDPFSLEKLEEGSLVIEDKAVNKKLANAFREDVSFSKPITLDSKELKDGRPLKKLARKVLWFLGES